MKKILILMFVIIGAIQSQAQRATLIPLAAGDTAVNTTTANKVISATAGYSAIGIQPVITKVSGTVAGKAYLYQSLDGTNYIKTDSITLADQTTNTTIWTKTTTPAVYYKVQVAGSGTMSAIMRVYYVARKHD
jgi:hypothetical protein